MDGGLHEKAIAIQSLLTVNMLNQFQDTKKSTKNSPKCLLKSTDCNRLVKGGFQRMKTAYPIILTPCDSGYLVHVPDLNIDTEGHDIADALYMAIDAISLCGITMQDLGQTIPKPSADLPDCDGNTKAMFVLVDFDAYRKATDQRTVRKNVSLPSYLNDAAEKAGLNFSRILQEGLKHELGIVS